MEIDENMTLEDFDALLSSEKGKKLQEKLDEMNAEQPKEEPVYSKETIEGIDWSLLEDNPDIDFE